MNTHVIQHRQTPSPPRSSTCNVTSEMKGPSSMYVKTSSNYGMEARKLDREEENKTFIVSQQQNSQCTKETEKIESPSRRLSFQPEVELPSASSRRPSFMQRSPRRTVSSDRTFTNRSTSDRRPSVMRATPSTPGRFMSYEEARAAAAAASRRNEEQRMLLLQQQINPINLSLSYEEARARAAAASRQHDERIRHPLERQREANQSPLKRQESFRRLRQLERALSNRMSKEHENDGNDREPSSHRQGIAHDLSHTSRGLRTFNNTFSPGQQEQIQSPLQIEIAPGIFETIRGANETWAAVEQGNIKHSECICCSMRLVCIADAEYVLCPECRVVIPLSGSPCASGVGLGLSLNEYESIVNGGRRPLGRSYTDQGPYRR